LAACRAWFNVSSSGDVVSVEPPIVANEVDCESALKVDDESDDWNDATGVCSRRKSEIDFG
jgi:hypothetical protein